MNPNELLEMINKINSFHPDMFRVFSKVKVNNKTECWEWNASFRGKYGSVKFNGKIESAHRVSYTIFKGEITNGLVICHKCDNKKCVNPDHLFMGTYSDNSKDAFNKGLIKRPVGGGYKKGHKPANRNISDEIIINIKKDLKKNNLSMKELSIKYNVPYHSIRDIKSNRSYFNVKI